VELAVGYLYLAIAIVGEVIATSALKASDHFTRPIPSAIVLMWLWCGFLFSLAHAAHPSVGNCLRDWAGAGTMLIALLGCVLFQQALDTPRRSSASG